MSCNYPVLSLKFRLVTIAIITFDVCIFNV